MLLLALVVAAALRFWALDSAPPGLYRDEAYNGLDALRVLNGEHAVFFEANNGREPAYIYLTALAVALFGRTVLALRLAAAVAGVVTTYAVYRLAGVWARRRTGLFAAWLWAVTLWPVHLSRVGLRPILLPLFLALTFWVGTLAYRKQRAWLWVLAGVFYGAAFYTYLAVRFTPLLLLIFLSYLLLTDPQSARRLWPGLGLFAAAVLATLLPLLFYVAQAPELVLGRAQQVSILSPQVNHGDLWGTLLRHIGRSAGLFLWQGDTIVRHNVPGRPLFDLYMALPFLLGLVWCLRRWRHAPAAALLLWPAVMLGPTILAEDPPHFLRAAGVLPAAVILPAVGLSKLWEWPKLPGALRRGFVLILASGALINTVADYVQYAGEPETALLFETAARELAQQINSEAEDVAVLADRRFWEGWPSIPFLVQPAQQVELFRPDEGPPSPLPLPVAIYAWPYERLDTVPAALTPPVVVTVDEGALARGDLEAEAYPLYVRYQASAAAPAPPLAHFGQQVALYGAEATLLSPTRLQVDLYWSSLADVDGPLVSFVHVSGDGGLLGQDDGPLASGYWPTDGWRPQQIVRDRRVIELDDKYDSTHQEIVVGLYNALTQERLPVQTPAGAPAGDTWLLTTEPNAHEEN
ncbi:MAG TPA: glycosyltransferase family 39 protein [Candidatus Sulfomarinibacteraceae bacterium]|nr:glycosyltransferase family 39 protein [Candidatus Sulfomarinibacteraceae bacterium]